MGRRPYVEPAPGLRDLLERAVHEIVRDFPEALSTFRARGVDVATVGGRRLAELPAAEDLARALVLASSWRGGPVDDDGGEPLADPVEPPRTDRP